MVQKLQELSQNLKGEGQVKHFIEERLVFQKVAITEKEKKITFLS